MTLVCCDTPAISTARAAPTPGMLAKSAAGRLANRLNGLACAIAAHHRRRLNQAALDALPFDLRKDLGWPAGDMRR